MPSLERYNPEHPCQPDGAHHPHVYICAFADDQCEDDWYLPFWAPYNELQCCVCGHEWPCPTKQRHVQERRRAHLQPPE